MSATVTIDTESEPVTWARELRARPQPPAAESRPTSVAECIMGKCPSPRVCDALTDCDAYRLRQDFATVGVLPANNDRWWAERWFRGASEGEKAAMRELLA